MSDDAGTFLREWFARLEEAGWTSEVFLDALSDDLVWTATGSSPVSGRWHGKQDYYEHVWRPLDEHLETWPVPVVERITAEGEWGVVQFGSRGGRGRNGTDYNMRYCWVIRVGQGRVQEVVGYYDTARVVALFA